MRFFIRFFVLFLISILLFASTAIPRVSSHNKNLNKFPFNFGGNLIFDLPILPNHIKLKGNIHLLNLAFRGDVNLEILSRKPLKIRLTSKKLVLDVAKILPALKKLGYLKTNILFIKGKAVVENLVLLIDGDVYNIKVGKIYGVKIYNNSVNVKNITLNINNKFKKIQYKIASIILGRSSITSLQGNYSSDSSTIKFYSAKLNFYSITRLVFKLKQNLKRNIIEKINQHLAIKNFYISGIGLINNFEANINYENKFKNIKLNQANFELKIPKLAITLFSKRHKKNKTIINITNKLLSVNYKDSLSSIHLENILISVENLFYPLKSNILDSKRIYISKFSIKNTSDIKFKLEDYKNINNLNINGKLELSHLILNVKNGSDIKINIKPISFKVDNKKLYANINSININLINRLFLIINKTKRLGIWGGVTFSKISFFNDFSNKNKLSVNLNTIFNKLKVNYKNLNIRFLKLHSKINLKDNILNISDTTCELNVNKQGKIKFDLSFKFPLKANNIHVDVFKNLYVKLNAKNVVYERIYISNVKVQKDKPNIMNLSYNVRIDNFKLKGASYVSKKNDVISLITRTLKIIEITNKSKKKKERKPNKDFKFDINVPRVILNFSRHYQFEIDKLIFSKKDFEYEIDNFKSDIILKDSSKIITSVDFYFCNLNVSIGTELMDGDLNSAVDIKTISFPVDHLLGCFLTRAPVYIKGDITMQFNIMANGKRIKEVLKNLKFDGLIKVDNGMILKLSNLGKKVELILDLLHFVKLTPSKLKDALLFNKLLVTVEGGMKNIIIKNVQLDSPVIKLSSWGNYDVKKDKLEFSGIIKKGFIKKNFHITKRLKEKSKEK